MSHTFTAIDFETAQGKRWSICQVGLVRVEQMKVVKEIELLICPPGNTYFSMNTQIHGISARHTSNAPVFSKVWHEIMPYIQDQTVVAHNGAFDFSCLSQTLAYYGLSQPQYRAECTYKLYGKSLSVCCADHNIPLRHHNALSDAMACAELYLKYITGDSI